MTLKDLIDQLAKTENLVTDPIVVRDDVGNLYDLHNVESQFGCVILQVHLTDLGATQV